MSWNWELNNSYECKKIPTTIKEVKIFIENFLIKLNNTIRSKKENGDKKNDDDKKFSGYEEIFSGYEEILWYLQDIRDYLSWVVPKTSKEISKTLIPKKNTLKEWSFKENIEEIKYLIEKWIIFKRYIDTLKTDSQNKNEIEKLLNTITRMSLIIGDNKKS